jgi:hypothetical protein
MTPKKIAAGFECYGSVGPATKFDSIAATTPVFSAIDPNPTDHLMAKTILGYRFDF